MIKANYIDCPTKAIFNTWTLPQNVNDENGDIKWTTTVYIKDTGEIWMYGKLWGGSYSEVTDNSVTLSIGGTKQVISLDGHTQPYTSLTGSTEIANQAILSTGIQNQWALKTLGKNAFSDEDYLLADSPAVAVENSLTVKYGKSDSTLATYNGDEPVNIKFQEGDNINFILGSEGELIINAEQNTDTTNTTGASNLPNTKLFVIGAQEQAESIQTYSNTGVFIGTDNQLYSGGKQVSTIDHNHDNVYLIKKGDTMEGLLTLHDNLKLISDKFIKYNDSPILGYTSSDNAIVISNSAFLTKIYSNDSDLIHVRNNAEYIILDSNNYSETLDSVYINASGDTMTGQLHINSSQNFPALSLKNTGFGNNVVHLGVASDNDFLMRNIIDGVNVELRFNASSLRYKNYEVWHEGNDGHNSGLDADLLDGYHLFGTSQKVIKKRGYTISTTTPSWCRLAKYAVPDVGTLSDVCFILHSSFDDRFCVLNIRTRGTEYIEANVVLSYNIDISKIRVYHDAEMKNIELYYLAGENYSVLIAELIYATNRNGQWNDDVILYTDNTTASSYTDYIVPTITSLQNNALSATKLQTPRQINGTDFDGTDNITTSKWGTARDIYIRDASQQHTGLAVNVDGSTNEYLLLPDIITASLIGNADTATKLQTPRTIWGQSFDGTDNINGVLNLTGTSNYSEGIRLHKVDGLSSLWFNCVNNSGFNSGMWGITADGTGLRFRYGNGITPSDLINILNNGNVGIGIKSPTDKLHVNGNVKSDTFISLVSTGTAPLVINSTTLVRNLNTELLSGYYLCDSDNPFNRIPLVKNDGTMKVGKYVDFHTSSDDVRSYAVRLQATNTEGTYISTLPAKSGTLAMLTDNVASASKLETSRTIWGQPFDGTDNVSGNLTEVGSITGSSNLTLIGTSDIHFKRGNAGDNSIILTANSFKPFTDSNDNIDLGSSTARWRNLYIGGIAYISGDIETARIKTKGISSNWSDTWTDGTNNHPWYGYDMGYPNTGIYSTTISDYYGMCLKTAQGLFCITEGGNIGINTTSPSEKLDVNGNIKTNTLVTTATTGTQPLTVLSTTKVTNFNADLLDGLHENDFYRSAISAVNGEVALSNIPANRSGSYKLIHSEWSGAAHIFYAGGTNSTFGFMLPGGGNSTVKVISCTDSNSANWKELGTLAFTTSSVANAEDSDKLDGVHLNEIFTVFDSRNNNVTLTIGGITKSLVIPYATKSSNSDTLGGIQPTSFLRNSVLSPQSLDANQLTDNLVVYTPNSNMSGWGSSYEYINFPTEKPSEGGFSLFNISEGSYSRQIYSSYNDPHICIRTQSKGTNNTVWGDWGKVALITDNVASASKLEKTVKIYGNDFDGTSDLNDASLVVNDGVFSMKTSEGVILQSIAGIISLGSPSGSSLTLGGSRTSYITFNAGGTSSTTSKIYGRWNTTGLGVGTSSPSYKLDVNGTMRVTNQSRFEADLIVKSSKSAGSLSIEDFTLSRSNIFGILYKASDNIYKSRITFDNTTGAITLGAGNQTFSSYLTLASGSLTTNCTINCEDISTSTLDSDYVKTNKLYIGLSSSTYKENLLVNRDSRFLQPVTFNGTVKFNKDVTIPYGKYLYAEDIKTHGSQRSIRIGGDSLLKLSTYDVTITMKGHKQFSIENYMGDTHFQTSFYTDTIALYPPDDISPWATFFSSSQTATIKNLKVNTLTVNGTPVTPNNLSTVSTMSVGPSRSGMNTVESLTNLPVDKDMVLANLSDSTELSLSEPLTEGTNITVIINPTSGFTQRFTPQEGWTYLDGTSISLPANNIVKMNITCYGENKYIVSFK